MRTHQLTGMVAALSLAGIGFTSGQGRAGSDPRSTDRAAATAARSAKDVDTVWVFLHHVRAGKRAEYEQWFARVWNPALRKLAERAPGVLQTMRAQRMLTPTRRTDDSTYTYVWLYDPAPPDSVGRKLEFPQGFLQGAGYSARAADAERKALLTLIARDEAYTVVQKKF